MYVLMKWRNYWKSLLALQKNKAGSLSHPPLATEHSWHRIELRLHKVSSHLLPDFMPERICKKQLKIFRKNDNTALRSTLQVCPEFVCCTLIMNPAAYPRQVSHWSYEYWKLKTSNPCTCRKFYLAILRPSYWVLR